MNSPAKDPQLSVIIPTRNRAGLLADLLQNLQAQQDPEHLEVLVVDDGSTDGTAEVVRVAATKSPVPAITYLRQESLGLNAGRNLGAANALAPLFSFLDDDARVSPEWSGALIGSAAKHPDIGCFAGRITLALEGDAPRWCRRHPLGETELELGERERETSNAWGANMIIRRSALDSTGPFAAEMRLYGDEVEWQHRYKKNGGKILYLPEAGIEHRRKADDLKLLPMVRGRYRKGRSWVHLSPYIDRRVSVAGGLSQTLLGLAHAVARLCSGGLFKAATGWGHTVTAVKLLVTGQRTDYVGWMPRRLGAAREDKS